MNLYEYNSSAWDSEVMRGNRWSVPVSSEEIQAARLGQWKIVLTPQKAVPCDWFPSLKDSEVLCLASGGGQQAPILAAAGARVTVLDASKEQLARDEFVAKRDGLDIRLVKGTMTDLSMFDEGFFDLIVHPVSNCFIENVRPVWREAFRVLKPGGLLLSGFNNPVIYCYDQELLQKGVLQLKYKLPYSDVTSLSDEERKKYTDKNEPLQFGHSLEDQIAGQLEAGFMITGFYEDIYGDQVFDAYVPGFISTRALKPKCTQGHDKSGHDAVLSRGRT